MDAQRRMRVGTGMTSSDRVTHVRNVRMSVGRGTWSYARHHAQVIDEHWRMAKAHNPGYFNGVVHLIDRLDVKGEDVIARLLPTEFKNFLYWRDEGYPQEAGVKDGFGSALIKSREGHVILGRQAPGNINANLAYLPGGFIDTRDVDPSGLIDLTGSITRELAEETGLGADEFTIEDGFLMTQAAAHVSFACVFRSRWAADSLVRRIREFLETEKDPELADVVVMRSPDELAGLAMPHYARVLLSSPLAWT